MVATPRTVHRDGIRFQGLRYHSPVLAPYVGKPVMIRYDPRDLSEIRVFHHNRFLCRAINPDHAGEPLSLKDIQTARVAHRRALREQLNIRRAAVAEYLAAPSATTGATDLNPAALAQDKQAVSSHFEADPDPRSARVRPPTARSNDLRLYQADSEPIDLDVDADPSEGDQRP
jgi:putative transposase